MRLRLKVFLLTGVVVGAFFAVTFGILSKVLFSHFEMLEKEVSEDNVLRLKNALNERVSNLAVKLGDWGQWDDTYSFVLDQNQKYVDSNLRKEALALLRINLVLIAGENNSIIFKKAIDQYGAETVFPSGLEEYFTNSDSVSNKNGILKMPDGLLLVIASRSVTSSDGSASPKGAITFGYFIDDTVVNQLSDLTQMKLSLLPYEKTMNFDGLADYRQMLSPEKPIFVENAGNAETISGFYLVRDIFEKPVAVFRAEMKRNIYVHGKEVQTLFNWTSLFSGLIFGLIIFVLFEFLVLRKIFKLIEGVKSFGGGKSIDGSVFFSGKDEFSQLGQEVVRTISACRVSEIKKRELETENVVIEDEVQKKNDELKKTISELERMNNLMSGRELKMIELKKRIKELEGGKEELNKEV